jgi:hypothetical protein
MNKIPSQTEMDEVFCAFYELSHRYKMIYGVDCETLIKVLEFWNELGKEEMEKLENLKYEPRMKAPTFPEYNKDGTIVGMSIKDILQFKISYLEATTSILSLEALLLTKLKSFGYKIEPYIQLSEQLFNHIINEAGIEKIDRFLLEDEQNFLFRIFNKV